MANFLFVHGGRRKRKFRERKERRRKEKEEQRRKEKENVQPERSENDLEGIRGEEEEVSDSPQLRFKPPTPAPFLLHFALPMEDGEEVIEDEEARHLHEQERSGCVGAWEEDGTLWRSHEPPPSQGHIAGIPQIRPEGGEKEMLVPSSSLLPPPLPPIPVIPPSTPIFQSIHHPEDSFVQSQIRQQQEEALAKEEEKEVEEEEENRVVEPLMRLVEAIFSLPTVRPRTHQQGRQGRKKSVKEERGDLKLPSSGEKQSGGEEARVGVNRGQTIADAENGGAERKRKPGNSHPHPHLPINPDPGQDHIPSPDNCLLSKQVLEQRGGRGSRRGRRKQGGTRSSKLPRTRFQRWSKSRKMERG